MTDRVQHLRDNLLQMVHDLEVLPTTRTVPMRLLELRGSKTSRVEDFAEVLTADSAVCAKVLQLANSAWFAPKDTITKVSDAILMIGLNNLLPLALSASFAGIYDRWNLPKDLKDHLWESALLKAVAAGQFASRVAPSRKEVAFISGLLLDVALPLMYAVDPAVWVQSGVHMHLNESTRIQRERAIYGTDHAEYGMRIVERMHLPHLFQQITAAHHDPAELLKEVNDPELVKSLSFAALFPHNIANWNRTTAQQICRNLDPQVCSDSGTSPVANLLKSVCDEHERLVASLRHAQDSRTTFRDFCRDSSAVISSALETIIGETNQLIHVQGDRQQQTGWRSTVIENQYTPETLAV